MNDAAANDAADHLAVPLLLAVEPVRGRDGVWRFRASYPEFDGCEATSEMLTVAIDLLEETRIDRTLALLADGHPPPRPRAPIPSLVPWIRSQLDIRRSSRSRGVLL